MSCLIHVLICDSNNAIAKIFSKEVGEESYLALVGSLCSTLQPVWRESDILLLSYEKGEFAPQSSWVSHTGHEYSKVLASYGEPDPCRDILYNQSYLLLGKTDCRNISFVGCNRDRVVKWELILSVFSMGKGSVSHAHHVLLELLDMCFAPRWLTSLR